MYIKNLKNIVLFAFSQLKIIWLIDKTASDSQKWMEFGLGFDEV